MPLPITRPAVLSTPETRRIAAGQCYACDAKATGHAPRGVDGGPWGGDHEVKVVVPACPRHAWAPDDLEDSNLSLRVNGATLLLERYPLAGESPLFIDADEQCDGCGHGAAEHLRWNAARHVFACEECGAEYEIRRQ